MSHGIHGHGHHGHHLALGQQHAKANQLDQKSGTGAAPSIAKGEPTPAAAQQPANIDSAMKALDEAIKSLAANFKTDSFNGQPPPAGVTPQTSLTPVDTKNDTFSQQSGTGSTAPAARDPLLDAKGGGGVPGGVVNDFLSKRGGGGVPGGVVNDRSKTLL